MSRAQHIANVVFLVSAGLTLLSGANVLELGISPKVAAWCGLISGFLAMAAGLLPKVEPWK